MNNRLAATLLEEPNTLDLYSHVRPTMQREATEALDDVLGSPIECPRCTGKGNQP